MKFLKTCKKIITKLCGKARWFFLAAFLLFIVYFLIDSNYSWRPYIYSVCGYDGYPIHEYQIKEISAFSIRDGGKMGVMTRETQNGIYARFNLDTGAQEYCGILSAVIEDQDEATITPSLMTMTDDGELYVYNIKYNETNMLIERYSIFRISPTNEIYRLDIGSEGLQKGLKMSQLNYYNGKVYFAVSDMSGVKLYSYDTKTYVMSESDIYPTEPDGTYTARILPVDNAFIFTRSDGNVYKVEFGKPMGESIYKFDSFVDDKTPLFEGATISDGKLYVAVDTVPYTVYLLEDGKLTKVFDIGEVAKEPGELCQIYSYRPEGASRDTFVMWTEKALITYAGNKPELKTVTVRPHITPFMYIEPAIGILYMLLAVGLVINIIIRKKTLLYKQLIITVPVFIILCGIIATIVYSYADSVKVDDFENDVKMVGGISTRTFDGYDFSGLTKPGKDTGKAYKELRDKLKTLSSYNANYNFSVIYRADDGTPYYLLPYGAVGLPMRKWNKIDGNFPEEAVKSELYIDKDVRSVANMIATTEISRIKAYGKIHDAASSGNYYLVAEADYGNLWTTRFYLVTQIFGLGILIMAIIMFIFILSTVRMLRVIKKATVTVKSISEGDLSARVNYSSKDELGQICSQVNEMASSLESSFEEKDRTEKFYYKFVPEKFREYLGKKNLTDLSLGDASNRELTVLFCDIRSFSINSEMMTAKENFAFVNTI